MCFDPGGKFLLSLQFISEMILSYSKFILTWYQVMVLSWSMLSVYSEMNYKKDNSCIELVEAGNCSQVPGQSCCFFVGAIFPHCVSQSNEKVTW